MYFRRKPLECPPAQALRGTTGRAALPLPHKIVVEAPKTGSIPSNFFQRVCPVAATSKINGVWTAYWDPLAERNLDKVAKILDALIGLRVGRFRTAGVYVITSLLAFVEIVDRCKHETSDQPWI